MSMPWSPWFQTQYGDESLRHGLEDVGMAVLLLDPAHDGAEPVVQAGGKHMTISQTNPMTIRPYYHLPRTL